MSEWYRMTYVEFGEGESLLGWAARVPRREARELPGTTRRSDNAAHVELRGDLGLWARLVLVHVVRDAEILTVRW